MDERLECSTLEIKDSQTECSWIPNTPVKHGIVKHPVCEENNLEIPQPTQADTRNCLESGESSVCRDASVMSPDFGNEGLILLTDAARESSYTTSVFEFEAEDEGATLQEESLNSSGAKGKSVLPEENNTLASTGNEDHVYLKTPQRKPKRKKHKPKVISSNQPKLNSRTTKPVLSEECTPTKAKCARKNAGNTSMKGRTDADTDTDTDADVDADTDADDVQTPKRNYTTRKSCIRSLDFDSYEQVATERSTSPCRSMLIQDTEARRRKRGRLFPDDIYFYSMNAVWDDDYSSLQECSSYIRQPIEFYEKLQTLEFPAVCKKKRTKRDARVSTNASSSHLIIPQHDDTNLNSTSTLGNPTPLKKGRSGGATWTMDLAALSWCPMIDGFSRQLAKVQSALEPLTKKRRSKGVTRPRDFAALSLSWCRMADGFSRQLAKVHSAPPEPQACTPTKRRSRTYVLGSSFPAKDSECLLSVDAIVEQFSRLDIAAECKTLANLNMNAKICVNRIGWTMISFDALNDHTSNSRPKVDLDEETTRVWKLLLEDINNEGVDGIDEEKRKTWQKEREVFHGRANSFIAKMRLIQGDRHFCRWKGSIVDSVVGVFLTQNVSDHLSSSAFMSMAARFPLSRNNKESTDNLRSPSSVYQDSFLDEKTPKCCSDTCFVELLQLQEPGCVNVNSVDAAVPWDAERLPNNCFPTNLDLNEHFGTEQTGLSEESSSYINLVETTTNVTDPIITPKTKRGKRVKNKKNKANWDNLRNEANATCKRDRRTTITMDSVDWEAVRCAEVGEIAETIKDRGMYNMLAERIKEFLNRVKKDHGSIDLEWLRDVPPDKAKEYLLSIRGLGLKSVECVRLLTLHHVAFPVDTNVGRIVVRLGWVPLQPLPESLQLHLLELYPVLDSIQKYLWPRLCKLDQKTLYELHYQMITFGKVFCTKNKPNCNSCPMRGECRHFASAYASARLSLPAPEEAYSSRVHHLQLLLKPEQRSQHLGARWYLPTLLPQAPPAMTSKPIIEEPPDSPEPEEETLEELEEEPFINNEEFQTAVDMEDLFRDDEIPTIDLNIEADLFRDDEIPTIDLNIEALNHNLQNILQNRTRLTKLQDNNSEYSSKALVVLTPEAASIPMPKLKNRNRLRTEHLVYVIPDSHELLKGLDKREINDPSPYLLAIWSPGETINCVQPPERKCSIRLTGELCCEDTCFACNSIRQDASQTVRGTILIPCRTAMRGSFPLNGTYFQVNEVFADHETSLRPINVPRNWLWNMRRQTVYFGTSIPTIFKGMGLPEICHCFRRGFVCVRGFDRTTRGPRPLIARLHFPASKLARNREAAESNS